MFPAALIAGLLSAGIFLAVAASGLGFFFLFLSTLPLLYTGLNGRPRVALYGALAASVPVAIVGGPPLGALFLLLVALPAWHLARHAMLWREAEGGREWYPVGNIMTELALYASAALALTTAYYAIQGENLGALLSQEVRQAFAGIEAEYADAVEIFAARWSFLILPVTIWLWAFALYAHGWMAQRLLISRSQQVRPDLAVTPFFLPGWLPGLLAIAAFASLAGGEMLGFLGKASLIALMLPYFFLGAALMHKAVQKWPNRGFFLFFVYFMVFTQFWPALALSGYGLWYHIKRLSGQASSSNS